MSQQPKPIPRVSAKHYAPAPPKEAAKVLFRIKGEKEGDVYHGQQLIIPCASCGSKPITRF